VCCVCDSLTFVCRSECALCAFLFVVGLGDGVRAVCGRVWCGFVGVSVCAVCGIICCGFVGLSVCFVWEYFFRVWESECLLCVGQFGYGLGE